MLYSDSCHSNLEIRMDLDILDVVDIDHNGHSDLMPFEYGYGYYLDLSSYTFYNT